MRQKAAFFVILPIAIATAFYGGMWYESTHISAASSAQSDQKVGTSNTSGVDARLVMAAKNAHGPYCDPVQVPYFNQTSKSIALYDQYNQLSIQISSGIFTSLCKLINQKGASLLDAITFVQDQRPPYFDGYATIALPDQTIQSPTTTYSYITYKTYLIAFTLSQGQNTSDLYINQIGEITNVQSISTLSILELPDNPMELGISGVDVWGKSFQHYIGTTHNKDDDSMGFDALHP